MVAPAFPLAKLGLVLVKQVSKPLANGITKRATKSKFFRDYFCIPVAQLFHWADVKIRMRILNLGKVTNVPKLDEKKAIETGAQIMSEFIILSIACGGLFFEYKRSALKEEAKQAVLEKEKQDLITTVKELELNVHTQSAQIRELTRAAIVLRDEIEKQHKSGMFSKPTKILPELDDITKS